MKGQVKKWRREKRDAADIPQGEERGGEEDKRGRRGRGRGKKRRWEEQTEGRGEFTLFSQKNKTDEWRSVGVLP